MSKNSRRRLIPFFCVFVLGAACFAAAAGAMQQTDKGAFCGSCHVMQEAVWTHSMSPHASLACNECHTPYNLPAKLPYKAKMGMTDVWHNTFGPVPDVIEAGAGTRNVVQANCRRCHLTTTQSVTMDSKPYCTDCHRAVPHMTKLPIDKRKAADV